MKEKAHFYHEVIYNQYGCVDEDEDRGKKNVWAVVTMSLFSLIVTCVLYNL